MNNFIRRGVFLAALRSAPFHSEAARIAHAMSLDPRVSSAAKRGTLFEPTLTRESGETLPMYQSVAFQETMPEDVYDALLQLLASEATSRSKSTPVFLHRKSAVGPSDRLLDPLWSPEKRFLMNGLPFATRVATECDSFIQFKIGNRRLAGQIHYIFCHKRVTNDNGDSIFERLVAVRHFRPLTEQEEAYNVYTDFPDLEANLHHHDFLPGIIIIRPRDIECHLIIHPYDDPFFGGAVVASLTAREFLQRILSD